MIPPQEIQSHYFWTNFGISDTGLSRKKVRNDKGMTLRVKMVIQDMVVEDFHNYKGDKRTLINNMVEPRLGLHILEYTFRPIRMPTFHFSISKKISKFSRYRHTSCKITKNALSL